MIWWIENDIYIVGTCMLTSTPLPLLAPMEWISTSVVLWWFDCTRSTVPHSYHIAKCVGNRWYDEFGWIVYCNRKYMCFHIYIIPFSEFVERTNIEQHNVTYTTLNWLHDGGGGDDGGEGGGGTQYDSKHNYQHALFRLMPDLLRNWQLMLFNSYWKLKSCIIKRVKDKANVISLNGSFWSWIVWRPIPPLALYSIIPP